MADLTVHRHTMMGASEEEIEWRMRHHYPDTVAVLVCLVLLEDQLDTRRAPSPFVEQRVVFT